MLLDCCLVLADFLELSVIGHWSSALTVASRADYSKQCSSKCSVCVYGCDVRIGNIIGVCGITKHDTYLLQLYGLRNLISD